MKAAVLSSCMLLLSAVHGFVPPTHLAVRSVVRSLRITRYAGWPASLSDRSIK